MAFEKHVDRKTTNSVKWNKKALKNISGREDAHAMWVADMDLEPEPHIASKGREIAEHGLYGYPSFDDIPSVADVWLKSRHNWDPGEENIVYSMGLLHGIGLSIDLFTNSSDRILIPSPTYRPFRELCEYSGRVMVDHELSYDPVTALFSLDHERFLKDAEGASMILFCSPHNPSGLVFSEEDLIFVLETAKRMNIPLVSDEIHADLVHPGVHHIPMGKANEKVGAKVITLLAPSKTFNVAGEHSAIVIFSDEAMRGEFKKRQAALWVMTPGYVIGELMREAYLHGLEYNSALCRHLKENVTFIRAFLKEHLPKLKLVNSDASFVSFIDCAPIYEKAKARVESNPEIYQGGKDAGVLSLFFGVDGGVALNDGTWFGPQYKNFVRINYGTSRVEVEKGLKMIEKAVKSLS